jgi:hypothetical protein
MNGLIIWEVVGTWNFFSCKYVPWSLMVRLSSHPLLLFCWNTGVKPTGLTMSPSPYSSTKWNPVVLPPHVENSQRRFGRVELVIGDGRRRFGRGGCGISWTLWCVTLWLLRTLLVVLTVWVRTVTSTLETNNLVHYLPVVMLLFSMEQSRILSHWQNNYVYTMITTEIPLPSSHTPRPYVPHSLMDTGPLVITTNPIHCLNRVWLVGLNRHFNLPKL